MSEGPLMQPIQPSGKRHPFRRHTWVVIGACPVIVRKWKHDCLGQPYSRSRIRTQVLSQCTACGKLKDRQLDGSFTIEEPVEVVVTEVVCS